MFLIIINMQGSGTVAVTVASLWLNGAPPLSIRLNFPILDSHWIAFADRQFFPGRKKSRLDLYTATRTVDKTFRKEN